jgi:hypothetical protein
MNIDSTFFKIVEEEHSKKFDWETNNCGLFIGHILSRIYNKDFTTGLTGAYTDKDSAFAFIQNLGGWDKILTDRGFIKRTDDKLHRGDVVVAENALGIWVGKRAFFAGGAVRERAKIEAVYYYNEEGK